MRSQLRHNYFRMAKWLLCARLCQSLVQCYAGADLGLNFWGGTDDVGGVISGCGQLSLPDLFLRSQNFEG